jgi:hypothetical protein
VSLFWFDIDYPRTFTPTGNFLDFRSPDTTAAVAYQLGPFTSTTGLQLLDTSDPLGVTRITGYVERDTTGGKAIYFHDDHREPPRVPRAHERQFPAAGRDHAWSRSTTSRTRPTRRITS